MQLRLKFLITIICLATLGTSSIAQTILITPDTIPKALSNEIISNETFFVNGPSTIGLTKKMAVDHVVLGPYIKISLSAITLRLREKYEIKLRKSISLDIPDVIEENPFKVAITLAHLMTETGGFTVPTILNDTALNQYALQARTAGQISHPDPVGWAILVHFLEKKSGKSIKQLFTEEILMPLGLKQTDLNLKYTASPLQMVTNATGSGLFIAEISRLMIRNQTASGKRYLPKASYDLLARKHSWRMHPLAPNHTFGAVLLSENGQRWVSTSPLSQNNTPTLMGFPATGVAFVKLTGKTAAFKQAVLELARKKFLPLKPDNRANAALRLRPYQPFSGYYVRDDKPSKWLQKRLTTIEHNSLRLSQPSDRLVTIYKAVSDAEISTDYIKKTPFYYVSAEGQTLILSPYKSGGYFLLDGILHRHIGVLGNRSYIIGAFPFAVILMLSSFIYIKGGISSSWKKMGQYGTLGTLLICAGLLCDYLWWPSAIFEWHMPYLVNIWRIVINVGLMLVLSVPLFALSFTRRNHMPEGVAIMLAPAHLAFLTFAAIALFLILVAWGMAGEFSAY
ncbi:MAG: beta-lactamase family protein [Kordiimonadaceae bacterium]|nr:beta-lactamase family protein [Kordiimonadaceae bacterium]